MHRESTLFLKTLGLCLALLLGTVAVYAAE